jgi:hypothetical protein
MAMGRSVIAIIPRPDADLFPLLACLNSRLLTALYRALAGEKGRILPQVKVARLHALPIPTLDNVPNRMELGRLVQTMLASEGRSHEIDRRIDRVIYYLYGLTAREIALVEGPDA